MAVLFNTNKQGIKIMKKIHFILPVAIILMGGNADAFTTNYLPINPCDHAFDFSTCSANQVGYNIYTANTTCIDIWHNRGYGRNINNRMLSANEHNNVRWHGILHNDPKLLLQMI